MLLFPYGDDNPRRFIRYPWVTYALIALNFLVFFTTGFGQDDAGTLRFALVPDILTGRIDWPDWLRAHVELPWQLRGGRDEDILAFAFEGQRPLPAWATLISYQFMHGNWMHVFGNMLFLWIFGDNVEDRMGHGRFLAFYLIGGTLAGSAHVWIDPDSAIPLVGASGAIAAVSGAYLLLTPAAQVKWAFWLLVILFFRLPAWFVIEMQFALDLVSAVLSGRAQPEDGSTVAHLAHLGGALAGLALVPLLKRREVPLFDRPRFVNPWTGKVGPYRAPARARRRVVVGTALIVGLVVLILSL